MHWQAVIRIPKYLKATSTIGIQYTRHYFHHIETYTHSDFANCFDSRRSTSGTITLLNGAPIAWASKRQSVVAGSTWEAEYIAAYHAARHTKCIQNLLAELGHPLQTPTTLHIDNAAALKTAITPHPTPKSKHIDVKYHHLQEQVTNTNGIVKPCHVPTAANIADILTKQMRPAQYRQKIAILNMHNGDTGARSAATVRPLSGISAPHP